MRNSATILEYLHVRFPEVPSLLPSSPQEFARCKEWELIADTLIDPIVTNCAIFKFGDLPDAPRGLREAAASDMQVLYDRLEKGLEGLEFVAGTISVADLALYPHVMAAQRVGLPMDERHTNIAAWMSRILSMPIGQSDVQAILAWWGDQENQDVETNRINWGTYRLEWFLAHGFHDWFYREIERDGVLWSVGPNNNANLSPMSPQR